MEKDIKPYLPFYLGCEVHDLYDDDYKILSSVVYDENVCYLKSKNGIIHKRKFYEIKIFLRKLSDMTEEGCADVYTISRDRILHESTHDFHVIKNTNGFIIHRLDWLNEPLMFGFNGQIYSVVEDGNKKHIEPVRNQHEITAYLLSKHFDLFGLIESGLAIDKTKLTQPA